MQQDQVKKQIKQLTELAVEAGRKLTNPQTNLLHLNKSENDQPFHATIPVYENLLFALALFKTRKADNVNEGKEILDKILYFQNSSLEPKGNFPLYIHHYPKCHSWFQGASVLYPLYWIAKGYNHILGKELEGRLQQSISSLLHFCMEAAGNLKPSDSILLKLASISKAIGDLYGVDDFVLFGEETLASLANKPHPKEWSNPKLLGEGITALQASYPSLHNSPWSSILDHISSTYHSKSGSYAGPGIEERQERFEPEVTLYDLVLYAFTGQHSHRTFLIGPHLLEGVLIQPAEHDLPVLSIPAQIQQEVAGHQTHTYIDEAFAYSAVSCSDDDKTKGFHPFKLVWGDLNKTYKLACQGGNWNSFHHTSDGKTVNLEFDLPPLSNEKKQDQDITLFVPLDCELDILVNGHRSNTFQLGESVSISGGGLRLSLTFSCHDPKAQFFGHLNPGNRPAQLKTKGDDRFEAFDTQILLRGVRREGEVKVSLKMEIHPA